MPQSDEPDHDGAGHSHNFPLRLDIKPLEISDSLIPNAQQARWIEQYGIAGRIWEAVPYLMQYLTPPSRQGLGSHTHTTFDPPCSLFEDLGRPSRILELGSGNGHLALQHLASYLDSGSEVVLTDLEEVVPLLQDNVLQARNVGRIPAQVKVSVQALPWGSHAHVQTLYAARGEDHFTHILCSDLVYFTHLLEPLLQTLLWLTEHEAKDNYSGHRKEVIFGYKVRGQHKEGAFWETLGAFFELEVVNRIVRSSNTTEEEENDETPPSPFEEDRLLILVARRKKNRSWDERQGKELMSYKDDQFERIIMLKLFRGL